MDARSFQRGDSPPSRSVSPRRVAAMFRRYVYLLRGSWPRLVELVYWPTVQMLMWGFMQLYLSRETGAFAQGAGILIGAVLLWDILFRAQLGLSLSFFEEMWSRNMGHLMMTPLRPLEFVAALVTMSFIRVAIGIVPVTLLAVWFFGFNLWSLGLALVAFLANLFLTSWSIGLFVSGLVLRNGLGAESLAWALTFLLLPLTCVYYPLDTLPDWLQVVSLCLPPTYVFEGMRAVLLDQRFDGGMMLAAFGLNLLYFSAGLWAFLWFFDSARDSGSLLQIGE